MIKKFSPSFFYALFMSLGMLCTPCLAQTPVTDTHTSTQVTLNPVIQTQVSQNCTPETKKQRKQRIKAEKKKLKEEKKQKDVHKTLSTMSYPELKASKERSLAAGNKDSGIRYLEKMIPMCNDLQELCVIMLELADLHFDAGDLEKAGKVYGEFTKLYPGNSKVEYASYKAILCSFYATLDADRDQSKTRDTLELADKFLTRSDVFTTHTQDVITIVGNCRKKLFESDTAIVNFYTNGGRYTSAQKHLELMRKDFIAILPEAEQKILALECNLAQKQNNIQEVQKKHAELAEKFPVYHQQLIAQSNKHKKSFLNRF